MIIYANLDQEAGWAGATLPQNVRRRISAASLLLAAFVPDGDDAVIYTPAPVDAERARFARVEVRTGAPAHWDLAWADPRAKQANDRRTGLQIAEAVGVALPGARAITSLDELDAHLAAGAADAGIDRRWVCKAPWTAAGRDRAHGAGPAAQGETRVHLGRMIERFGCVIFEPWMERVLDLGVSVQLRADGSMAAERPHTLICDTRGAFVGIDLLEPALTHDEHVQLARTVDASARALHAIGYHGPLTVDAFVYRELGVRKLHPLCEINARHSFGHVARALAGKLGTRVLGFGPPPAGEPEPRMLVVASAEDPFTAWAR